MMARSFAYRVVAVVTVLSAAALGACGSTTVDADCTKQCDDKKTQCVTACSDDACKSACTTTYDDCTTTCDVHVTTDGGA